MVATTSQPTHSRGAGISVDFHRPPIFVNLSLFVLMLTTGVPAETDERAILLDKESMPGRLQSDPAGAIVFRAADG